MIRWIASTLLLALTLGVSPQHAQENAAAQAQVNRAASLLFLTFYRKLDAVAVVDAERSALMRATHGVAPPVPRNLALANAPDAASMQLQFALAHTSLPAVQLVTIALKAMTAATHDRYTTYFSSKEYHDFDEVLDPAKRSGIGVLLDVDAQTKYVRAFFVVPNTPADRAGLHSGDLITSIDTQSTRGWSVSDARRRLLGAAGSSLALTFARAGSGETVAVTLVRENVQPPTVYFTMLPNNIAYIYVSAFGNPTGREFRTAIARSEAAGAAGYVLDLRNDGGGIVGTALEVSSSFVPSGPIVSIESNGGQVDTYEADANAISPKPVTVLVNQYTASASEITAAAIAESGTGILIGTRTFGKGVVQSVTRFPDGSAIKITTGRYYTPLNHDINGRGIVPGVLVPENSNAVFGIPEKDAQLRKALEIIASQIAANEGIVHS